MTKSAKVCCSLAFVAFGSARSVSAAFLRSSSRLPHPRSPAISDTFFGQDKTIRFMMSASNTEGSAVSSSTVDVADNLRYVQERIQATCEKVNRSVDEVRLVAVSKTKPLELLKEAYDSSHRIFGENYAQELVEKAAQMPSDVEWHFIGSLQSNKANMLVKSVIPVSAKLTIETVSSVKLANKLNSAMDALEDIPSERKLNIFIQVNTSGEDSKSGIEPSEVVALCKDISEQCNRLKIQGLMTIGAVGDTRCFDVLAECRTKVIAELGMTDLELSMGMSDDFEEAIERGATNVRVGSTIFGARKYANKT